MAYHYAFDTPTGIFCQMVSTPALRSFLGAIEINLANVGWYSHSILRDFYLLE